MRSGRRVVSYNGEIYNFRELQRDLEGAGVAFSTQSDTEALLRAWDRWGADALERLTGMFAFALWDEERLQLTLARDRFGIKPLYVARTDGLLVFASEIRAILASDLIDRHLNLEALPAYLAFQTTPTPRTLVEGVEMLPPATMTTVDAQGRTTSRQYWDLLANSERQEDATAKGASARVWELLEQSITSHLVSDVPIGVFLSGGIDSSALVSGLDACGVRAQTFSVAFAETAYDESPYSREVAEAFGSEHTELRVSEENLLETLPEFLAAVDHPSGDGANTFVISKLVRERGVKVAWSGLGGDELFCGYPSFARLTRTLPMFRGWTRLPASVRRVATDCVQRGAPSSVLVEKVVEAARGEGTLADLWPVTRQLFGRDDRARLLADPGRGEVAVSIYATLLREAAERFPGASLGALISYAETRAYMHDVLLRDTDQTSMAHGLEVRVPLLDHRLAEYLVGLPDGVRMGGRTPKALLVESLPAPLPKRAVDRPKRGFTFPFESWMRAGLRSLVEHHLGSRGLEGRQVFRPGAVMRLWQDFLSGRSSVTWSRIWILVALDAWMDRNGMEVRP